MGSGTSGGAILGSLTVARISFFVLSCTEKTSFTGGSGFCQSIVDFVGKIGLWRTAVLGLNVVEEKGNVLISQSFITEV